MNRHRHLHRLRTIRCLGLRLKTAFFSDCNNRPLPRKRIKYGERPDFYDRDELPMIVVDEQRSLEVHISPKLERTKGAEVLRLSTHEYFRRVEEQKKGAK